MFTSEVETHNKGSISLSALLLHVSPRPSNLGVGGEISPDEAKVRLQGMEYFGLVPVLTFLELAWNPPARVLQQKGLVVEKSW